MRDERVQPVKTGPVFDPIHLLACTVCGVLVWDIDKHYEHAHPKPFRFWERMTAVKRESRVGTSDSWCSVMPADDYGWTVYYMWGGLIGVTFTRWGAKRMALRHLRNIRENSSGTNVP